MSGRPLSPAQMETHIRSALLGEVYTTPKPGLVDLLDNGAHRDMDYRTFERSTEAVAPALAGMFRMGTAWAQSLPQLFDAIRPLGLEAEAAMLEATGGVNTHKGILFTLGILCAGAGYCQRTAGRLQAEAVLSVSREMTAERLAAELAAMSARTPRTHGEILYRRYSEEGIRGQARRGFPILGQVALPLLRQLGASGANPAEDRRQNEINLRVLLAIMSQLSDTNVLSRSDPQTAAWLRGEAERLLQLGGPETEAGRQRLLELNRQCIRRNVSPGGAADMLAAALLLVALERDV